MAPEHTNPLHPAQIRILQKLAIATAQHFSDLTTATGLTSDHANFHLKRLLGHGLVQHVPKSYGEYRLTRTGKDYVTRMNISTGEVERLPKVSIVLWITDKNGDVLRQRRLKQPYYGYWTRPTGKVRRGETVIEAATRKLHEETGLAADLRIIGVEHRIDHDEQGELYDDKYLFMVEGTNPRGDLIVKQAGMHNYWMSEAEYARKTKRFGKPISTTMSIEGESINLTEGIFTFSEEDY